MDIRCPSRMHGRVVEDGTLEVKCNSSRCKEEGKAVVLHYFNISTGELVRTEQYREPKELFTKKES